MKSSGIVVAGLLVGPAGFYAADPESEPRLRFGMVTDVHFADTAVARDRYYRESQKKMYECAALMNDHRVDFLVELGDFKDQGNPALEQDTLRFLKTIEKTFRKFKGPRYHVLGNHDMDSISKEQFLARVSNTGIEPGSSFYSFDARGLHFVVLDANYKADGSAYDHGNYDWTDANIPETELDWLRKDLGSTTLPVIVFVHQQLDGEDDYSVRNAPEVRRILQESRKVLAVFQGHRHPGQYSYLENIHYYTLKAMVTGSGAENNSYAIVEVHDDLSLTITGYRRAESMGL